MEIKSIKAKSVVNRIMNSSHEAVCKCGWKRNQDSDPTPEEQEFLISQQCRGRDTLGTLRVFEVSLLAEQHLYCSTTDVEHEVKITESSQEVLKIRDSGHCAVV